MASVRPLTAPARDTSAPSRQDPSLGGFAYLEGRGPDGLVADDAARRMWFGEDLA